MEILNKILFHACWLVSAFLFALGYYDARLIYGVGIAVCYALAWISLGRKFSAACLVLSVLIAVAGILLRVHAELMFAGIAASLAAWDLSSLRELPEGKKTTEQSIRYKKLRVLILFFTLAAGLFSIFIGRLISIRIPFFIMLIIVCVTFIGIERLVHYLNERRR